MDLERALLQQLELLQEAGLKQLRRPRLPPRTTPLPAAPAPAAPTAAPVPAPITTPALTATPAAPPARVSSPATATETPLPPVATPPTAPVTRATHPTLTHPTLTPPAPTLPATTPAPAVTVSPAAAMNPVAGAAKSNATSWLDPAPRSSEQRRRELDVLNQEVCQCRLCPELASTRKQTVFGIGNIQPRLCLLGEAPGAQEDATGEPFVGEAGQLLNKIIAAMGLRREDLYILNVLKCRPPGNRVPAGIEAENCRSYFERQLEILQPEFICCLGTTAAHTLLNSAMSVGKLRGRFHSYRGAQVLVTYHPSYLLRNPSAKKDVWIDMQILMKQMGLPLPAR
ncbi:MAG: uracil-DNA glycosylase family protein [Planctomycetota bacterium]